MHIQLGYMRVYSGRPSLSGKCFSKLKVKIIVLNLESIGILFCYLESLKLVGFLQYIVPYCIRSHIRI
jgi:hypothetical protein